MSVSTKRGDTGQTSLILGGRVSKAHPRVWAYGTVDELTSAIGMARTMIGDAELHDFIKDIQMDLIQLMGELATEDENLDDYLSRFADTLISSKHVDKLTARVDQIEATIGSFKGWILPGENELQARFDNARTVCRRAERYVVQLVDQGNRVRPEVIQYLNRMSDLLWLLGFATLPK